ncbi:MAG: PH domain-containing protein [Dehalococcoidales bacterium]|nr:PH domain-containing protein [Dehalococcoidales bacterium]
MNTKVPRDIRQMLLADEKVRLAVKQSRWKALFTPDTIVVTNQRVIRYSPSGFLGLHKDIEDYRYEDMANFKISKGIMFATVTIGHRFLSESLVLDNLPKGAIDEISKAVEENIRKARGGIISQSTTSTEPLGDPLTVLKLRFARGEITKEQFEDMRRALE